ncbi:P-loop NTPase fold protein [Mycobacteroides chelonae]|uniref:KAP family P-loop NTPase fold protein n=1 Tax=Mycobacteroides chelonae TaxID=1774 RepID=UPI003204F932
MSYLVGSAGQNVQMGALSSMTNLPVNTDGEVQSIADDKLGRAPFARRVAERIAAAGEGPSVVFGLSGPWGSGKSTVLNMITQVLRDEHQRRWRVVRFSPWATSDLESLTNEFYQSIAAAMDDTGRGRRAALELLKMTPAVAAAAGKAAAHAFTDRYLGPGAGQSIAAAATDAFADKAGSITFTAEPFVTRFEKAAKAIKEADTNILVIVDDIDRLHTDELLTVLKAVRLLGRFDHVHYLLSYDEQALLDVLETSPLAHGERRRASAYLEKIVQYPYMLPPLQPAHVTLALQTAIEDVARVNHVDLPNQPVHMDVLKSAITRPLLERLTLRSIHRLASQVDILLNLVGAGDLNFIDAVLITFVRLFYPPVYDRMPSWRAGLLGHAEFPTVLGPVVASTGALGGQPTSGKTPSRIDWARRIAQALNTDPEEPLAKSLTALLGEMFAAVKYSSNRPSTHAQHKHALGLCSIDSAAYFDRYFSFRIPVDDASDVVIREEFRRLCLTGELPPGSLIAQALRDALPLGLVEDKLIANFDVIDEAPFETVSLTAHALVRGIDRLWHIPPPNWAIIISALVDAALQSAPTDDEALKYIDGFADEFGLLYAASVLSDEHRSPANDRIQLADKHIRHRIEAHCRTDLTTPVDTADIRTVTVVRAAWFLDDTQWASLAAFAATLIGDGIDISELAAKFVTTVNSHDKQRHTFRADLFKRIVSTGWDYDSALADDEAFCTTDFGPGLPGRTAYTARLITVSSTQPEPTPR